MKITKKEIEILTTGTHQEKMNLGMAHYCDEEWMTEALKYVKVGTLK